MSTTTANLLISAAITAAGAGIVGPEVLDLVERAQVLVAEVDASNRAQVIEAASVLFEVQEGRAPASLEELVAAGYLKVSILK